MQYHKFFLEHIDPSDTVLDVGSGNGKIAFEIAHKAKFVIGVDIRPQNVELSRNQFQRHNLSFEHGDATTHNFQQDFDVIVLSNVLEHIEHRIKFLIKLSQAAPKILIRVPMLTRDWVTVHKKNLGLEYRLDDTHFTEFTLESFNHEINAAGLKIEELTVNFGEIYAVCQRS